jgi:hypothetical protein
LDADNFVSVEMTSYIPNKISVDPHYLLFQDQIIDAAMKILISDSEGFPRRAAISLICHLYKVDSIPEKTCQKVYSCVAGAGKDFDWEVKVQAVEFWKNMVDRIILGGNDLRNWSDIPSYAQALYPNSRSVVDCSAQGRPSAETKKEDCCVEKLERLQSNRCLESLLLSVGDYDRSVKSRSCKVLFDLRTQCESEGIGFDFIDVRLQKIGLTRDDAAFKLDSFICFSSRGSEIDTGTLSGTNVNGNLCSDTNMEENSSESSAMKNTLRFLCTLFSLDLETLMKQSEQTTDEYASNPESLLDDIIAWSTESEDILIDCY